MRILSERQIEQQTAQPPLTRLPHLREQVVAHLVRHIVGGYYPPGSAFPTETELAHSLGVSRALVREAVRGAGREGARRSPPRGRHTGTATQRIESARSRHVIRADSNRQGRDTAA